MWVEPFNMLYVDHVTVNRYFSFSSRASFLRIRLLRPCNALNEPYTLGVPTVTYVVATSILVGGGEEIGTKDVFRPCQVQPKANQVLNYRMRVTAATVDYNGGVRYSVVVARDKYPSTVVVHRAIG